MFAVNESFLVFYSEWFLCQLYQLAQGSMVSEGRGCGTLDVNRRDIGLWFLSWCVFFIEQKPPTDKAYGAAFSFLQVTAATTTTLR